MSPLRTDAMDLSIPKREARMRSANFSDATSHFAMANH